jgi:hypothetical protein
MKSKMNFRKKYAAGTNLGGMGTPGQITSPNETLNDYNIMLAKASSEAMSNPWLPVVSLIGGLAQQTVGGLAGKLGKKSNSNTPNSTNTNDINASLGVGVQAAMGMNNVQQNVEVEGGEMYETPQGQVGEFQGPTHEEGGIPLEVGQDVEEGTKVYSDRLKIGKKTLAERKATRERQKANLEKQATQPNIDQALKNALQRKMAALQQEEDMDLQFQGQVDEMQQMADMAVQAFAYGTSMEGIQDNSIEESMRYGYGTNAEGIKKYSTGTTINGIQYDKNGNPIIGFVDGFGMNVDQTEQNLQPLQAGSNFKFETVDMPTLDLKVPNVAKDALNSSKFKDSFALKSAGDAWANKKENQLPTGVIDPSVPDSIDYQSENFPNFNKGVTSQEEQRPSKFNTILSKLGESTPGIGDLTKLAGNYMGMTAGTKTAYEQRASDVTQKNTFANAGKKAQELYDQALKNLEGQKAQALLKSTTQQRTAQRSGRNSARGINQVRAIDWLYNSAATTAANDIVNNTQGQIAQIFQAKAGASMNADQMVGTGEYQANMANMASKDAFYTALGQGRKDFATGLQQTGKDLNDMKENKIIQNLMKNYGKWVGASNTGELMNKAGITQDSKTKQYKDASGKILTEEEVQAVLLKVK